MFSVTRPFGVAVAAFGLALVAFTFAIPALAQDDMDDPGVNARVARVGYLTGQAGIKRSDAGEWERMVGDLPIVSGDEVVTESDARLEIQFDRQTYMRVAAGSYFRVSQLDDAGIALSLYRGSVSVRAIDFDTRSGFFEIDAPGSTIALLRAGRYRIDAATSLGPDVSVSVAEGGQARVYSSDSGFTLNSGRTALLTSDGRGSDEWQTIVSRDIPDEFDIWIAGRDSAIDRILRNTSYNRYYGSDVFGADDLDQYGEWVFTRKYGYVWRPYASSISTYAGWSPYRYGQWRWVPPFGWTWVNDEPWGWATYHHGRWIYDDSRWYWSPYGGIRPRRSWWRPALVGVNIYNNNVYWYPLPYGYGYYNYNHHYGSSGWGGHPRNNGGGHQNPVPNANPTPTPKDPRYVGPLTGQVGPSVFIDDASRRLWMQTPPLLRVPPAAVAGTPLSSFGRDRRGFAPAAAADAKQVLAAPLADNKPGRILPTFSELGSSVSTAIRPEMQPRAVMPNKRVGVADRGTDRVQMDTRLRDEKIFGGRSPVRPAQPEGIDVAPLRSDKPRTGAVPRPRTRIETPDPVRPDVPAVPERRPEPVQPWRDRTPEPTVRQEPRPEKPRYSEPRPEKPRYSEPTRPEPVRPEPPRAREPRYEPVESKPRRQEPQRTPEPSRPREPASETRKAERADPVMPNKRREREP